MYCEELYFIYKINLKRGVEMKRFLLIALAIVLVFSLGACMDDDTNGPHIGNKEAGFDENATANIHI